LYVPQKSSESHTGAGASVWGTFWHHNISTTIRYLLVARALCLSGHFAWWPTRSCSGTYILLYQWRGMFNFVNY